MPGYKLIGFLVDSRHRVADWVSFSRYNCGVDLFWKKRRVFTNNVDIFQSSHLTYGKT